MARLSELIERVERLTGPDRKVDLQIAQTVLPNVVVLWHDKETDTNKPYTHWEYTASLDAAIALTRRLYPSSTMMIHVWPEKATVGIALNRHEDDFQVGDGAAQTPAIALVLATLKALAAREGADE